MHPREAFPWANHLALELNLTVRDAVRLEGGRINENWQIESDQGVCVFRLYPSGRKANQIEFETDVLDHLVLAGCRVPSVLTHQERRVGELSGRNFVFLEFIDAVPLSLKQAREISPARLAQLLVPIRASLEAYQAPFRPVFETRVFERRLPRLVEQLSAVEEFTTARRVQDLFEQLDEWGAQLDLPSSVIHADIHPGNVLSNGQELWLIDFDDGHVGLRALDWILPALEFSLTDDNRVDEQRYSELLDALSRQRMTHGEEVAEPGLRLLLELKFAVSLADCGERLEDNPYFKLLAQRFARTTLQQPFPELRS